MMSPKSRPPETAVRRGHARDPRPDLDRSTMSETLPEVFLARHGETEWTVTHRHTGRTDIPLTERGERNARSLGERLQGISFDQVLVSPMQRARRTCELAGWGDKAQVVDDLREWEYG